MIPHTTIIGNTPKPINSSQLLLLPLEPCFVQGFVLIRITRNQITDAKVSIRYQPDNLDIEEIILIHDSKTSLIVVFIYYT